MSKLYCFYLHYLHNETMNKQQAIDLFGSVKALAAALDIGVHAVYMWPDDINQRTQDQVTGAALRLGLLKPDDCAA